MSDRYAVVTLDELVPYETERQARWHAIRRTLDIQAFGMNAWTATEDGQQVIGEHAEADGNEQHEEVYVVVSGHATFTLDGETFDAPSGTARSASAGRRSSPLARSRASRSRRRRGSGRPRRFVTGRPRSGTRRSTCSRRSWPSRPTAA